MVAQVKLFDPEYLDRLLAELQTSMRGLLRDLCEDLERHDSKLAGECYLPADLFRMIGRSLLAPAFSTSRVVGWIEELNDLVFFLDLRQQLKKERRPSRFAEDCFEHCREAFYENRYFEELFPANQPEWKGLKPRLSALCGRLAQRVTQDALFLCPDATLAWLAGNPKRAPPPVRSVAACLGEDMERAELAGRLYLEPEGAEAFLPGAVRRALARRKGRASLEVRPSHLDLKVGAVRLPLFGECRWQLKAAPPHYVLPPNPHWPVGLILGPTLEYGRDLIPRRVMPSPPDASTRIEQAVAVIEAAWPEGAALLGRLTQRVVPLKARGVVSFSYRHRPGLSFINTFDRSQLDLIDDLIHENSHHHLNLLLRKYDMRRGDHHQEVFYSPWRRSLRPLHGILHATFTFTMGAALFERLVSWAERRDKNASRLRASRLRAFGLSGRDILRARFRCLEEIASVDYSMRDLSRAAEEWGWLSPSGVALVRALAATMAQVKHRSASFHAAVRKSSHGPALDRHRRELELARHTYGQAARRKRISG